LRILNIKIYYLVIIFLCFTHTLVLAQNMGVLDWPEVQLNILKNHPLAASANLLDREAVAALFKTRGGFDPKTYSEYASKDFKGKHYYSYAESGVKVPTWAGIEVKGSYSTARGNFLNEERSIPANGQVALGINWALGQGLLIDERRANLRGAKIGIEQNAAERDGILNELVYEGAKAYWNWTLYENQLTVVREALRQAALRSDAILESYLQGDKPAIDTLEAFIQLQNRQLDQNFALADAQNAKIALQYFYWTDQQTPIDTLSMGKAPALNLGTYTDQSNVDDIVANAMRTHPDLRYLNASLQILGIERKLKVENRKPIFDVNYNILGSGWSFFPSQGVSGPGILSNDIKWGIDFSYPILNRKARGDVQLADIKIDKTNLKVMEKRQSIENKIRQYCNELRILSQQVTTYRDMVNNYKLLLDAENTRFFLGESSIFLINTREQKWLEAQVKYLKLLYEYRKTEATLLWVAGTR